MRDIMVPMSFDKLIYQCLTEYRMKRTIFGVKAIACNDGKKTINFCGGKIESPLGIAAGPHTQLAQNVVACYAGGARFIELKTVQIMHGEELGIQKPCIRASDEAYNVEWSSELHALEARDEYIRAWFATKIVSKEFSLGDPDAFEFNMSVGYNLEGVKSLAVNAFLDGLNNARTTLCFQECQQYLLDHLELFENVDEDFIRSISPKVVDSICLSTMHGCPAEEIEKIATYLLEEKRLNTFIKCNPTLLGFSYLRNILDDMGYDYIHVDPHQFEIDLKFDQAVLMINNLLKKSKELGVEFGVKLSNTMPVEIKYEELPGDTMYMSGKSLYPLTISLAQKITKAIGEELQISYSGGADKNNIKDIFEAGIYPITICTTLLQQTGYEKIKALHDLLLKAEYPTKRSLSLEKITALVDGLRTNKYYCKSEVARKKTDEHIDYRGTSEKNTIKCKVLCQSCIRVCPNRANTYIETATSGKIILHIDDSCNECGNCQFACVQPCHPFRDRFTLFSSRQMMEESQNKGVVFAGDIFYLRTENTIESLSYTELPPFAKEVVDAIKSTHAYLIYDTQTAHRDEVLVY